MAQRTAALDTTATADEARLRQQMVEGGRWLLERGFVEGTAGNLSCRLDDESVLVSPTTLPYPDLQPEDIVKVDLQGKRLGVEPHAPTSELAVHLECLRRFPEIGAVVHSHAITATAFAMSHRVIACHLEEMALLLGGDIEVAPYQFTGTAELGEAASAHLSDRAAVLLANHGLLVIGRDLEDALHKTAIAERCAEIAYRARTLGETRCLPDESLERLTGAYRRHRFGS